MHFPPGPQASGSAVRARDLAKGGATRGPDGVFRASAQQVALPGALAAVTGRNADRAQGGSASGADARSKGSALGLSVFCLLSLLGSSARSLSLSLSFSTPKNCSSRVNEKDAERVLPNARCLSPFSARWQAVHEPPLFSRVGPISHLRGCR